MEPTALLCELEYQEADAASGRNRVTVVCASAALARRRSGVEVASLAPAAPLRKALKLQSDRYELYFRFAKDGKMSFIRRDAARIYQFNVRGADPQQLVSLVRFCLRLGAQPKSPLASLELVPPAPPVAAVKRSRTYTDDDNEKLLNAATSGRRPLTDRSNLPGGWASPPPLATSPDRRQAKRRRRLDATVTSTALFSHTQTAPPPPSMPLTPDQKRVLALIAARRNVFFTGSAGTGKSFLLQQILAPQGPLREYVRGKRVFATATTGIAAYNIGGMTLHHFAGLDARAAVTDDAAQLAVQIKRKKDALQRWRAVDVLVIDEVSMLDGRLFDLLEQLARELRPEARTQFFGGIQLVLSGDFCQLPPVASSSSAAAPSLCFESRAWQRGVRDVVALTQVFRQTNSEFVDILNALRVGAPTSAMIARLNAQYKDEEADASDDAIRIFTHNKDVLETNNKRLDALAGRKFNYVSADSGRKDFLTSCPAPPTLSLNKNARVMLIKSINPAAGLVNGCRGVVVAFSPQTNLPIVKFANGSTEVVGQEDFPVRVADAVLATRRQLPLALAWAISIHKSQGLAFPAAVLDLSRVFEFGQAYVALSRVRSLEGLRLKRRLDERRLLLADPRVLRFYDTIGQRG